MEKDLLPVKSFQETLFKSMCGPACLKMVFDYYGIEKSEQEIAKVAGTDELGTDEKGIIKAHNGRVWAESPARHSIGEGEEGEGSGSVFFVELPTTS